MPLAIGTQIDTNRIPVKGLLAEQSATALGTPVEGLFWHDTANKVVKIYLNGVWMTLGAAGQSVADGDKGEITVASGGTVWTVDAGVITDTKVAAANKDGVAGTASMRTLGLGAQQALAGTTRLDQIAAPTAAVSMNSQWIQNLPSPVLASDAANKSYVDTTVQGLDAKASCKMATTANITLSGNQSIDGTTTVNGDRILVKNQTTASENGIYVANAAAWTRATDMNSGSNVPGAFTWIEQGTVNADTGWLCITDQPVTVNTTPITWTQFSGAAQISAGTGLTKTGNTLALDTAYTDARYAPISVVGTVKKYNTTLGAMTAGAETLITHSLGTTEVISQFRDATTNYEIAFGWRVVNTTQIGVTPDISYSASAVKVVVVG